MRPLTSYLHKAMIPFSGLPFLAYSLLCLPRNAEVIVIVNYFSEQIINYFGDAFKGRKISYFTQTNPQGTGDALFQFSEAYRPERPVVVWQADQMIFPAEVRIVSESEPNAAVYSDTSAGLREIGFWKIKPGTLARMKDCFERGEFRALPVLEKEGLNQIKTHRDKLELSFSAWTQIEQQCKRLKQRFHTEFH